MCEQIIMNIVIKPLYSNIMECHVVDIVTDTTCMTADSAVSEIVGIICKNDNQFINNWYIQKTDLHWWTNFSEFMIGMISYDI